MEQLIVHQFYWGKLIRDGEALGDFQIIGHSTWLPMQDALYLFQKGAYMGPYTKVDISTFEKGFSQIYLEDYDSIIIGKICKSPVPSRGYSYLDYHCMVVSSTDAHRLQFNLSYLFQRLEDSSYLIVPEVQSNLPTIEIEATKVSVEEGKRFIQYFYESPIFKDGKLCFSILTALLQGKTITIVNGPTDTQHRLMFSICLQHLLPVNLRYLVSFATGVFDNDNCRANIKFLYKPNVRYNPDDIVFYWDISKIEYYGKFNNYCLLMESLWDSGPDRIHELIDYFSFKLEINDIDDLTRESYKYELTLKVDSQNARVEVIADYLESLSTNRTENIEGFVVYLLDNIIYDPLKWKYSQIIKNFINERPEIRQLFFEYGLALARQGEGLYFYRFVSKWPRDKSLIPLISTVVNIAIDRIISSSRISNIENSEEKNNWILILLEEFPYTYQELSVDHQKFAWLSENTKLDGSPELISFAILNLDVKSPLLEKIIANTKQGKSAYMDYLFALWQGRVKLRTNPDEGLLINASEDYSKDTEKALIQLSSISLYKGFSILLDEQVWERLLLIAQTRSELTDSIIKLTDKIDDIHRVPMTDKANLKLENLLLYLGKYDKALEFIKDRELIIKDITDVEVIIEKLNVSLVPDIDVLCEKINKMPFKNKNVFLLFYLNLFNNFSNNKHVWKSLIKEYFDSPLVIDKSTLKQLVHIAASANEVEIVEKLRFKEVLENILHETKRRRRKRYLFLLDDLRISDLTRPWCEEQLIKRIEGQVELSLELFVDLRDKSHFKQLIANKILKPFVLCGDVYIWYQYIETTYFALNSIWVAFASKKCKCNELFEQLQIQQLENITDLVSFKSDITKLQIALNQNKRPRSDCENFRDQLNCLAHLTFTLNERENERYPPEPRKPVKGASKKNKVPFLKNDALSADEWAIKMGVAVRFVEHIRHMIDLENEFGGHIWEPVIQSKSIGRNLSLQACQNLTKYCQKLIDIFDSQNNEPFVQILSLFKSLGK
ncbi:MAG: hypothetical protein DPW16_07015 [Chloroflexi bacterium]|nr:hypothetical protein [Chloroflexota bacterium]